MYRVRSADKLDGVLMIVNGNSTEVWLRRNIERVEDEDGTHWEADEVRGEVDATTSGAYIAANFDALWDEWVDTPLTVRIADVRDATETHDGAIVELAEMVAEGEVTMEDLSQAIIELAEIIGGGE